ncbi:hypothetical protein EDB80DRAFT_864692 [Ilyonectria destructans]|nr:hypothetical protein EDB80DRAFT_864692 [Ilyonectria destructans]
MPGRPGGNTVWDKPEFLMELGITCDTITSFTKHAMAGRQTMRWDANVHEDILICLFQHLKLSTQDWINVMQDLQDMDYTFTESALRYGHV